MEATRPARFCRLPQPRRKPSLFNFTFMLAAAIATRNLVGRKGILGFSTTAAHSLPKSVKSAVVVMPAVASWDPIQRVRRENDKSFYRWMPHINILYPFHEDRGSSFQEAAQEAEKALRWLQPVDLQLHNLSFFQHGPRSCTVWAGPEEGSESAAWLQSLHASLLAAFPQCTDLNDDPDRGIDGFEPHLSLGGWPGPSKAESAIVSLQKGGWEPLEFAVDSVYLISRKNYNDPFSVRWAVPLGGGGRAAEEKNLRYSAAAPAAGDEAVWGGKGARRKARPASEASSKVNMHGKQWDLTPQIGSN